VPLVEEALLVPFYVRGKAVGTIWAVSHDPQRKFDAEDELSAIAIEYNPRKGPKSRGVPPPM